MITLVVPFLSPWERCSAASATLMAKADHKPEEIYKSAEIQIPLWVRSNLIYQSKCQFQVTDLIFPSV